MNVNANKLSHEWKMSPVSYK